MYMLGLLYEQARDAASIVHSGCVQNKIYISLVGISKL